MATNLTDRQLIILGKAGARGDHAVLPLPDTLKLNAGAATLVLKSLITRRLIEERPAERGQETWQERNGQRFALKITEADSQAIGVEPPPTSEYAEPSVPPATGPATPRAGTKLGRRLITPDVDQC